MTKHERVLRIFLRIIGTAAALALFCVLFPYSWMNAIHEQLGMGELPRAPIVGYLARCTSAFYALLGGLLWVLSFNVRRFRPVLIYAAIAIMGLGVILLAVDFIEGLPRFWSLWEGPINLSFGILIFWLSTTLPPAAVADTSKASDLCP